MSDNERKPSEDEEEDEDDDYSPTNNTAEASSSDSEEHDGDEQVKDKEEEEVVKPYDPSKVDELWKKTFTTTATTTTSKPKEEVPAPAPPPAPPTTVTVTAAKRPASAASVLDRLGIGKKQKLSTLEKSRLDWQTHKESEALTADLESHRRGKDSYVEKQAFLQRTETREHDHYLTQIKKK